jgi:hypothetical protein
LYFFVCHLLFQIPTLSDLCSQVLAKHFDSVESIDCLGEAAQYQLADYLVRSHSFKGSNIEKFVMPDSRILFLPECSQIDEQMMISLGDACAGEEQQIVEIHLKNCGHGFTDQTAAALSKHCAVLETLYLFGLYKLHDTGLSGLLSSCSETLSILDLSCNSRLGPHGLESISGLRFLTSLAIDNCAHLTDHDLMAIVGKREHDSSKPVERNKKQPIVIDISRDDDADVTTSVVLDGWSDRNYRSSVLRSHQLCRLWSYSLECRRLCSTLR